ncbi:hypothetical protein BJX96DRAFT_157133, partial [Aspergillus floccosus]
MGEPAPTVRQLYGEMGQLMVDRLAKILCDRNPASSLSSFLSKNVFISVGFLICTSSNALNYFLKSNLSVM